MREVTVFGASMLACVADYLTTRIGLSLSRRTPLGVNYEIYEVNSHYNPALVFSLFLALNLVLTRISGSIPDTRWHNAVRCFIAFAPFLPVVNNVIVILGSLIVMV